MTNQPCPLCGCDSLPPEVIDIQQRFKNLYVVIGALAASSTVHDQGERITRLEDQVRRLEALSFHQDE